MAKILAELNIPKDAKILDAGAGTGLTGEALKDEGFTNIDALEPSPEMLDIARAKNIYKDLKVGLVSKNEKLPYSDNTYDLVVLCGVILPGHARVDDLEALIPIVKRGENGLLFVSIVLSY